MSFRNTLIKSFFVITMVLSIATFYGCKGSGSDSGSGDPSVSEGADDAGLTPDPKAEEDLDVDKDGVLTTVDNCPNVANADQADLDSDGEGDACDTDDDGDGVADDTDNCLVIANAEQLNNDKDEKGDLCDTDDDNDGVLDEKDNCQFIANPAQTDKDEDGIGALCEEKSGVNPVKTLWMEKAGEEYRNCVLVEGDPAIFINKEMRANSIEKDDLFLRFELMGDIIESECEMGGQVIKNCHELDGIQIDTFNDAVYGFSITAMNDKEEENTLVCEWIVDATAPVVNDFDVNAYSRIIEVDNFQFTETYPKHYVFSLMFPNADSPILFDTGGSLPFDGKISIVHSDQTPIYYGINYRLDIKAVDLAGNIGLPNIKYTNSVEPVFENKLNYSFAGGIWPHLASTMIDTTSYILYGYKEGDHYKPWVMYKDFINNTMTHSVPIDPECYELNQMNLGGEFTEYKPYFDIEEKDGKLHAVYYCRMFNDPYVFYRLRHATGEFVDSALMWSVENVTGATGITGPDVKASDTNLFVVYDKIDGNARKLNLERKPNGEDQWYSVILTKLYQTEIEKNCPANPSVAVHGEKVYVTYRHSSSVNDSEPNVCSKKGMLRIAYCDYASGQCENNIHWTDQIIAQENNKEIGRHSRVAVDGSGCVHIVYDNMDDGSLYYMTDMKDDGTCWGADKLFNPQYANIIKNEAIADGVVYKSVGDVDMIADSDGALHIKWMCSGSNACPEPRMMYTLRYPVAYKNYLPFEFKMFEINDGDAINSHQAWTLVKNAIPQVCYIKESNGYLRCDMGASF